jgi:lipopolysaccharide biosynthesis glycosyltransferase
MSDNRNNSISTLWSFDDHYAGPFAAMATSIRQFTDPSCQIELIVVADFLSAPVRQRIEQVAGRLLATTLRWLQIDVAKIADAPVLFHFTMAAYARLLAFEAIDDRSRVLYLDCDMVCLADVRQLWMESLHDKVVGAVVDPATTFCFDGYKEALGLDKTAVCFNSGMLLVDLNAWRRQHLTEACLDFLHKHKAALRWLDQDILNGVIRRWHKLPSHWNVQTHFLMAHLRPWLEKYLPGDLASAQKPRIVHFNAREKPWHPGYAHPFATAYHHFHDKSGWELDQGLASGNAESQRKTAAHRPGGL